MREGLPPPAGDLPSPLRGDLPCRPLPQRVLRPRHSKPSSVALRTVCQQVPLSMRHQRAPCVLGILSRMRPPPQTR